MSQSFQGDSSTNAVAPPVAPHGPSADPHTGPSGGSVAIPPAGLPMKRRRGRPRKDPSLKRVGRPQGPPRLEQVQQILPPQLNLNDGMIGQAVAGVVEAAFEAGYLLSVRIGDSNTNYRGVVFKPGHFNPITAENDVAPHVQMIRRMEVNLPAANQVQVHGQKGAEPNGSLSVSSRSPKRKQASLTIHPSVPQVGARGTVVPVVLQPVNLTNGSASSHDSRGPSQPPFVESVKDKDVQTVAPLAMLPPDQAPPAPSRETLPSQGQINDKAATGAQKKEEVRREEVKPNVSLISFNQPVVQATMGSQGSAPPPKTGTRNVEVSRELSFERPPGIPERREPAIPPLHTQATSVSKPLMNFGTGRMTELLQAVQEAGDPSHVVSKKPKTESSKE